MKTFSIRTLLLAFSTVVLLSSAAIGSFLLYDAWASQLRLMKLQLQNSAATIAHSMDRELQSGVRRVQAITASLPADTAAAREELYVRALALKELSPELRAIALNSAQGQQYWNTRTARDVAAPVVSNVHEQQALRSGRPTISDVYRGRNSNVLITSLVVPVMLGGQPHMLVASLDVLSLAQGLQPAVVSSPGGVAGLLDRNLRFVTRTIDPEKWVGQPPSPDWLAALRSSPAAGVSRLTTLEGVSSYSSWARLPTTGWTFGFAVPAEPWEQNVAHSLLLHGIAALLLALVGAAAAYGLGRQLVRDSQTLRMGAHNMLQGQRLKGNEPRIAEFGAVYATLAQTSLALREQQRRAEALEAERADALARESDARRDAERANTVKDEFLGVLGHEMRNPLAAITTAAHVLVKQMDSDPRNARLVHVIGRQARTLTRLVDDLLEVGRLMGDKVFVSREPLDLAAAVQASIQALDLAGTLARHQLHLDLNPTFVEADPVRIGQVVTNLLTNAARYTPPGGDIHVAVRPLADGGATLEVRDTGIGLRQEDLQRVFELFVQADNPGGAREGLGVGLSVVKRIVELHGGSIAAHSDGRGRGCAFSITLPRSHGDEEQPARDAVL